MSNVQFNGVWKRIMEDPELKRARTGLSFHEIRQIVKIVSDNLSADAALASPSDRVIAEIAAERRRQIEQDGWTPGHDDQNKLGQLAGAAACYAMHSLKIQNTSLAQQVMLTARDLWPWAGRWWKPANPRRDLIKAGALIVAEIERLDRKDRAAADGGE